MQNYYTRYLFLIAATILQRHGSQSVERDYMSDFESEVTTILPDEVANSTRTPLRKCHCDANEFWLQNECRQANTTVDVVTYYPVYEVRKIQTSEFLEVVISTITCRENETSADVPKGVVSEYGLMHQESGNLFENYCVENKIDEDGNMIMASLACLPKQLSVPLCCSTSDDDFPSCEMLHNLTLPTIKMGTKILDEIDAVFYNQEIPEDSPQEKVKLYSQEVLTSLEYRSGKVILFQWSNSMQSAELYFPPSQYCLVEDSEDQESLTYSALVWWDNVEYYEYYDDPLETSESNMDEETCEGTMHWVLLPLVIISTVFLVAILVLHGIMPSLRKSIGSKITICHMVSLLAGFCLLIVLHIPQNHHCKIYGPLIQFSFLSTFFWLNIMCFDIWWKLRCDCPAGESPQSSKRRFTLYSAYAWGCPFVICVITIAMDNISSLQANGSLILPGFAEGGHCWFADRKAVYIYYFGIIAALMVLNVGFFVWVFIILVNANCVYNQVLNRDSADNKRMWIYLKIFCLMGVTWICEFFSWQEGTCRIWIATDIINALRGLILFLIFFGNRKSVNKIWERMTSLNETLNTRLSRSMNNLRKLSLIPSMTLESAIDSRRTSEVVSPADLPNKANRPSQDSQPNGSANQRKRNASTPVFLTMDGKKDQSSASWKDQKPPSCPSLINYVKKEEQQSKEDNPTAKNNTEMSKLNK